MRFGLILICLGCLTGCPDPAVPGGGGTTEGTTGPGGTDDSSSSAETGDTGVDPDTGSSTSTGPMPMDCDEPGGVIWGEEPNIPAGCEDVVDDCRVDTDHDGIHFACDNAPDLHNPLQADADGDLIGDGMDLCPVLDGDMNNTADSDDDGIGNACDNCRMLTNVYNENLGAAPPSMLVRNVPSQVDTDQDGIGDPCDNCPTVPNCADFGPDNPAVVGSEVPYDDPALCQTDSNADGIGDACQGDPGMGFGDADDFDGDGVPNGEDLCPRLGIEVSDADGDGLGNQCDTCPVTPNPEQITAPETDDPEGDFVGNACETAPGCVDRRDPRPVAFFDLAVDGFCCVTTYPGDGEWFDPDGVPVTVNCTAAEEAAGTCRAVPASTVSTPGVFAMPAGCEQLLVEGCEAQPVTIDDVGGDIVALWDFACLLPQRDQDFDGVGDVCDLCPFGFDPANDFYVDVNGMDWPNDGRVCNGEYVPSENLDPANNCVPAP